MKAAGKRFEPVTYDGAGHGFMRAGEDPANTVPGNKTAREEGFARLVQLLKELKSAPAANTGAVNNTVARKPDAHAVSCHGSGAASPDATM
jgi:carboxymethylenebutenolidase